jgi:hypothetical protein
LCRRLISSNPIKIGWLQIVTRLLRDLEVFVTVIECAKPNSRDRGRSDLRPSFNQVSKPLPAEQWKRFTLGTIKGGYPLAIAESPRSYSISRSGWIRGIEIKEFLAQAFKEYLGGERFDSVAMIFRVKEPWSEKE